MAATTLARWGIVVATTALAAAIVVGCSPDREDPVDTEISTPASTSQDAPPSGETTGPPKPSKPGIPDDGGPDNSINQGNVGPDPADQESQPAQGEQE